MKYRPIHNRETMEIVQSNRDVSFATEAKKSYRDPLNQFSPRMYKVIKFEKKIKSFMIFMSLFIFFAAVAFFILTWFKVKPFSAGKDGKPLVGYLVLFAIIMFVSFANAIKNAIEKSQWSNTVQRHRDAISAGDYTSSSTFHLVYKRIVLKDINLLWLLIFVLTYLGLITLIIFGLYKSGNWEAGSRDGSFYINLEWPKWLDKSFKNTQLFCLICTIIMALLIVAYVIIRLIDKRRLDDIGDFFGEKSVEIHEQIETAKHNRNKMWVRVYLVVVALTIFLPLALILVAIWRGIIRRKKRV
ncbi:MSC_0882 family membrane protein [Mycoplasmopsis agalactiae]|uniref:MSC_0882 family membrane protein n=1 Tax=Mycoplasmopsis agalactiae TaxID=2110 RepID=UPI002F42402A